MHGIIDLRSDTVTKPTAAMRQAMAEAEVGDDVYADDPTVNRLQERAALLLGKEAALFVPSGTMANNVAIRCHTSPGDEILTDWNAHSLCFELGAPAVLSLVQTRQFHSRRGVPDVAEIEASINKETLHTPGTALIVLENTHNRAGGTVIPLDVHRAVYSLAKERGLKVHIDGARIFNASVATGLPASQFAAQADTICFCLSKGLGCPVGSLLYGPQEFIDRARRVRKLFGGAMRQAGILAAAGLVALDTMIGRLADDHRNARRLAEGIRGLPGMQIDFDTVQTNMVFVNTTEAAANVCGKLAAYRVRCNPTGSNQLRLVTHNDIDEEDVEAVIQAFCEVTRA